MEREISHISQPTRGKRHKALWAFLIFGFSVFLCNNCNAMTPDKNIEEHKTIILDRDSNGKETEVALGDFIQIELEAKGATGYQWRLEKSNPEYAELVSEGIKSVSGRKVGAPVTGYWKFRAVKEGRTEILFLYFRPWEGPSMALENYILKLKIR
jgi:predicted secreted protein